MDKNKLLAELQAANAKIQELSSIIKEAEIIERNTPNFKLAINLASKGLYVSKLEDKITELEQQLKKADELLSMAMDELFTCSRATVFGDGRIQKENAISCGEMYQKIKQLMKSRGE